MTAQGAISPVPSEIDASGRLVRQANAFRDRITADGSSGYPTQPGRYHLYVSLACPWAHRAIIARRLLGLEEVVSLSVVDPIRDERGWAFREGPGHTADPVNGFAFLSEAYLASDPTFVGRYTVPAVWDRVTRRIVTNDYPDITIQLETAFADLATTPLDLYPEPLWEEIDAVNPSSSTRSTTGSTRPVLPPPRPLTRRRSTRSSPGSTGWRRASPASATSSAGS